jgi:hypothetical protein
MILNIVSEKLFTISVIFDNIEACILLV